MNVCAWEFPSECVRLKPSFLTGMILVIEYMELTLDWCLFLVSPTIYVPTTMFCLHFKGFIWCRSCLCCRLRLWFCLFFIIGKVADSDERNYPNFKRTRTAMRHHGTDINTEMALNILMRQFMGYIVLFLLSGSVNGRKQMMFQMLFGCFW